MKLLMDNLVILPVLIPMVSGAAMLLLSNSQKRRQIKIVISILSCLALLVVSALLCIKVSGSSSPIENTYLLGNWEARFGIALIADRLSVIMVTLCSILALPVLIFSLAYWYKMGVYYLTTFQFLIMGINGAFLTADLFNLFVFFEILLAGSYGLVLHASDFPKVKSGMHYIVINLFASLLFLIGISIVYSVCDALNIAEIGAKIPHLDDNDRTLIHIAFAFLMTAFLIKAGSWPLCFWLPETYSVISTPAAAIFAILTKVGIYTLIRLVTLFFGISANIAHPEWNWIFFLGLTTLFFGAAGVLASQDMKRLAAYSVLVSSGTLLAALGSGKAMIIAGSLYYLLSSTIAITAFFLLIELMERGQDAAAEVLAVTEEAYGIDDDEADQLDDRERGMVIPAMFAILGICFIITALIISGLPPFSGFIGKFAILSGILNPFSPSGKGIPFQDGLFAFLVILSGIASLIAMSRAGIRTFWPSFERTIPHVSLLEISPIAGLLSITLVLTVLAGPLTGFMDQTARSLYVSQNYTRTVLDKTPFQIPRPLTAPETGESQ